MTKENELLFMKAIVLCGGACYTSRCKVLEECGVNIVCEECTIRKHVTDTDVFSNYCNPQKMVVLAKKIIKLNELENI
jgi:hypothetical protein